MAISKIVKVRNLYATINYVTRNTKTDYGEHITAFQCDPSFAAAQFNDVTQDRRNHSSRSFTIESWMIFQSFAVGEVEPGEAHGIGVELAKRYLGDGHQYIVTTHVDAGHVHNHIVFNSTNYMTFKSFDSRNEHIISDLRKENDDICEEHGLSVITEQKGRGISQREFYARKQNRSYKAQLESFIDTAIMNSDSYEEFLGIMDRNIEVRFGNTITFRMPGQERPTRITRLGIDYSENSIKYRIDNKWEGISSSPSNKVLYDTSESKFRGKENVGLLRWATRQNIELLAEKIHVMSSENITSEEYESRLHKTLDRLSRLENELRSIDKKMASIEEYLRQEAIYRQSHGMIQEYKKAVDKQSYKKEHYTEFAAYDKAKRIIAKHKDGDGKLPRPEAARAELDGLAAARTIIYTEYQATIKNASALDSGIQAQDKKQKSPLQDEKSVTQ